MQQQVHYSVSIHAAPSRTVTAQQPTVARADDVLPHVPSPTTGTTRHAAHTEQHASPADVRPPQNGFKAIKDAARRDFFTIRADSVQDAALSLLDSLAEYLVWDGMDRRLRATASATHTDYPEAIVSVQQIANDIKIRVGHDLCERTIERALKKLCDVGLILATPRFHQGRRQASSYMLLYAPSMAERLENSRRGRIKSASTGQEPPQAKSAAAQNPDVRQYKHYGSVRIGDMIPGFPMNSGLPDVSQDPELVGSPVNTHAHPDSDLTAYSLKDGMKALSAAENEQPPENSETTDQNYEIEDSNPTPGGAEVLAESGVCQLAHYAASPVAPGEEQRASSHPTSMSPLFNKTVKENKKVFKNVFSISDFSKNNQTPKPSQDRPGGNGYFLDSVHQKGWISTDDPKLLPYLGDLSRYAFFAGHRTLDALSSWFQGIENDISDNRTTLEETLLTAGIPVSDAPITRHEPVKMSEIRFGC